MAARSRCTPGGQPHTFLPRTSLRRLVGVSMDRLIDQVVPPDVARPIDTPPPPR